MAATASLPADDPAPDGLREDSDVRGRGLLSFLAAGAVLFASLVAGSSASLMLAGANDLIAAILEGFLMLGLWALGGFLAAAGLALAFRRGG
jgi:hypothetical protein